jgi:hypothetical protein
MKEFEIVPEEPTGPLTYSELVRYNALRKDLTDQLEIIHTAFRKVGRILRQIRDERLYRGDYSSFEQFCQQVIGKGKRYLNQIIQAEGVVNELLFEGINERELPNSERICRELAQYPKPEMKKIWQKARQLALASGKAQPDSITVREAAATIEGSASARDRQAVELVQRIESIQRMLKMTIGWGDLSPKHIERLRTALNHIVTLANTHLQGIPKEFDTKD